MNPNKKINTEMLLNPPSVNFDSDFSHEENTIYKLLNTEANPQKTTIRKSIEARLEQIHLQNDLKDF